MEKVNYKKIIAIAIPVLILIVAVILIIYLLSDCNGVDGTIVIESDGVASEEITVENLELYPGDCKTVELAILSKVSGTYNFSLKFNEVADGGLKQFVIVDVYYDDEIISSETLSSLLGGKDINFDCNVEVSTRSVLKIIYKMPIETDDTAQDTTSSFIVALKIEN